MLGLELRVQLLGEVGRGHAMRVVADKSFSESLSFLICDLDVLASKGSMSESNPR